jgi:PST family polysaccharide transporter
MAQAQPALEERAWTFWGAFGGSSWYLSEKLLRLAGAFLVSAWVARYLGPLDYGTLAFGVGLVAMAGFLGSLGLESVVVRDLVQHQERENRIASSYFLLRLCGAVLVPLIACAYVALTDAGNRELLLIVAVLGSGVVFSSFEAVDCVLQARHAARTSSLIRVGGFVAGALAKIALVIAGAPLVAFAVATIVEPVVVAGLLRIAAGRLGVRVALRELDWVEIRALLVDGRMMILSGLTVIVYSKIDLLVVGELVSKEVLGSYAIAAAMCGAWNTVGTSITQAYAPHISASRTRDRVAYIAILRRFLLLMLGMSVTGSLALAVLSPWIFHLLLGPAYREGGALFSVLVWSSVPAFLGVATSQIIVNEKLYRLSLLRTGLGMLTMLALVAPAARAHGAAGVCVVVVVSATVATFALLLSGPARAVMGQVLVPGARA